MKKFLIFIIRCYQIIPFASHKLCRFTPTCSEYMIEAINTFGIKKGIQLGIKRIKKCHPKGDFGYDPVPKKKGDKIMKKIKLILLLLVLFITTACDSKNMEDLQILTTVYPISYITSEIYPEATITSIYPEGADIENYTLTAKQIKGYSKNDILIYNGLSNELQTAKNLINKNRKLKVIDVAYGLKFNNGMEELWLSPNYYLMLATTIKNNLQDFTDSKYVNEDIIEKNYQELEEKLSLMDAELRNVAKDANNINKGKIVVSSNMFKYLNNYGFEVISLEDKENQTPTNINAIKSGFKDGTYTTLFMKDTEEKTDVITTLEKDCNAKIIKVNTMTTLSTESQENQENYLTIMSNYIKDIKNATLGE